MLAALMPQLMIFLQKLGTYASTWMTRSGWIIPSLSELYAPDISVDFYPWAPHGRRKLLSSLNCPRPEWPFLVRLTFASEA